MFVFQLRAQKPIEQTQNITTQVYTGKEAQRILQGVAAVSEQVFLKVHSV